jgi:hypothetical protein
MLTGRHFPGVFGHPGLRAEARIGKGEIMSTRLAAVGSLDDQWSADPVYRSIIALDLEESTMRTNPVKGELRRVMYDLLGCSLEAAAITGNCLEQLTDRGDGVLMLVRPFDEVPKTVLLNRLIPLLAHLLREYNAQVARPELRMRLRVVVHAGEVHMDRRGCYGEAIDIAIRLLDAPRVKKALKQAPGPLVLVISDEIYSGIVQHGYVDAKTYLPLGWVSIADRRHRGWIHIPGPVVPPSVADPAQCSRPAGASGSAPLAITDERKHYPAAG